MSQENNFIPSQDGYKKLTPFQLFVKSNFPFIENTYESLDNYGLYCKVVEYLNTVIENENTVESNVQALYNAFVSLNTYVSNYFDNLDVQEEINNKLDEMVTTGALQEIIADYFYDIETTYTERYEEINNEFDDYKSLVNGNLNTMNAKINSATSGSPAGVYPTVAALESADPNHSKIYLVAADGKWYYYNTGSSSWAAGGTYQTSGINYNSITPELTSFLKPATNLIDKNANMTGKYINLTNGNLGDNVSSSYSDYVVIDANENAISTSRYDIQGAFYDASKTFISSFHGTSDAHENFAIPANALFMRYSYPTVLKDRVQINYGATIKEYDEFYYEISPFKATPIINNKSIDYLKTDFLKPIENLIDISKVTRGYFKSYNNGDAVANPSYCYSDYIYVGDKTNVTILGNIGEQICFYNKAKQYKSGLLANTLTNGVITIPSNISYMIISYPISHLYREYAYVGNKQSYYTPFNLENELVQKTIYVGQNKQFEKLTDAIAEAVKYHNCKVIVEDGTYDLVEEYGSETLEETSTINGIHLSNGVHVIFHPQAKVIFNYTGESEYIHKNFSPFNSDYGGFTLEGLNLECSNCRYCVHDERGGSRDTYTNKYINCIMSLDNSQNPDWSNPQNIGAGFGRNGTIIIDNCKFNSAITFHTQNNAGITDSKNQLFIKNTYTNSIFITRTNNNPNETLIANVNNCSITGWNVDNVSQIKLYEYNNIIRT